MSRLERAEIFGDLYITTEVAEAFVKELNLPASPDVCDMIAAVKHELVTDDLVEDGLREALEYELTDLDDEEVSFEDWEALHDNSETIMDLVDLVDAVEKGFIL